MERLSKVTIERSGDTWIVTRERINGEKGVFLSLTTALSYVSDVFNDQGYWEPQQLTIWQEVNDSSEAIEHPGAESFSGHPEPLPCPSQKRATG